LGVLGGENALSTSEAWNGLCASIRQISPIDVRYEVFEKHTSLLRALKEHRIDFALVDPAWFVKEKDWVRPLVGTEILGSSTYRVMLIVPRNSIYYKTSDLRLENLLLTGSHESAAGFYIPLAVLLESGVPLVGSPRFLDAFESILKGVAYGKGTEAGPIPFYLWEQKKGERILEFIRVLEILPFVPCPIVVGRKEDEEDRHRNLKTLLLSLHTTEEGTRALAQTPFSKFTLVTGEEDSYRNLAESIRKVEAVYGSSD
jgi:ABC-type phosphate/phosphonate transport system substrate-binding protein